MGLLHALLRRPSSATPVPPPHPYILAKPRQRQGVTPGHARDPRVPSVGLGPKRVRRGPVHAGDAASAVALRFSHAELF